VRVSIHISHWAADTPVEKGAGTARASDDAQFIQTQLLIGGVDAEVVDGPVSDAPESDFWFVFEHELPWHLTSLGAAKRDRFVMLRPSGRVPYAVRDEAAAVTYDTAARWTEPPTQAALALRGGSKRSTGTLTEELVRYLRSLLPPPQVEAPPAPGSFPIGETYGRGKVRVTQHLRGGGFQKLFLGTEVASGASALIAYDYLSSRVDVRAFERSVAYDLPGVFPLVYVGKVDFRPGVDFSSANETWVLAERVSDGAWLPSILGLFEDEALADPKSRVLPSYNKRTALADALSLGRSAGRILLAAARNGLLLTRARPDYMWARRSGDCLEVTGLSGRGDALFAMTRVCAGSEWLFDRHYYSPEEFSDDRDDRALSFSLAIMVSEWATGRYPYKYKFHDLGAMTGKHLKLSVPKPLAQLLASAMAVDRDKRPRLSELVDGLVSASASP